MDTKLSENRVLTRQTGLFEAASRKEIGEVLQVSPELLQKAHRRFPVQWPKYYLQLSQEEAVAKMGRPTSAELEPHHGDIADPISDQFLRPVPFVVRKHQDRVILLTTKKCHFYCRFCFRREEPVSLAAEPSADDWTQIYAYLAENPEIREPILSGGDPLTLSNVQLFRIQTAFCKIPSIKKWRIHTRAPVVWPKRITPELMEGLSGPLPLTVVAHYNHASEITPEAQRIAGLMAKYKVVYKNQAVLLAGVNNRFQDQFNLWQQLHELGIEPHYIHHPDRVPGNAQFRTTIQAGLDIYRQLKQTANFPLPSYVLDLPDGTGKVPVEQLEHQGNGLYHYQHPNGVLSSYRDIE